MKIPIFFIVLIFSFLVSLTIQIEENHYNNKFLSNSNRTSEKEKEEEKEKEIEKEESDEQEETKEEKEKEIEKEESEEQEEIKEEKEKEKEKGTDKPTDKEEKTHINIKCLYVSKYNVYTLQKLIKDNGYTKELSKGKFKFNFCKNLEGVESTAVFQKNTTKNISQILYSGSIEGSNSKNEWTEIEEDNGAKGLRIKLAEGAKCDSERNHRTIFKIYCNDSIPDDQFENNLDFSEFNENGCTHYIKGYSIYACALNDWHLLKKLMKEYNYYFASFFILLGLFFTFWGKRLEKLTLMLVIGALLCYLAAIIFLNLIPSLIQTEKHLMILLGVGFIIGAIIGIALKGQVRLLAIIMGGISGYSLTELAYQIASNFISADPTLIYYIVLGSCILIGAVLGYCIIEAIVIIGTSIIGGYIVMRGVTLIFDNYMELSEFADLAKNGEWEELKNIRNGWVFAYIGLWLVLSIVGLYYQCHGHKKRKGGSITKDGKNYEEV